MAWRVFVRTKRFWLVLAALVAGIGLSARFATRVMNAPLDVVLVSAVVTFVLGSIAGIRAFYSTYRKYPALFDRQADLSATDREEIRSHTVFLILTSTPLLIAGLTSAWLLIDLRVRPALAVLLTGAVAWQLLRLGLKRERRR